jgi:predicted PurR-regulated permease PerM
VVFFALLGGLAVFGGIGILLGPLITTFLVAAVRLYARDYGAPAETAQEDARTQALEARAPPPLHDDGERPPLS